MLRNALRNIVLAPRRLLAEATFEIDACKTYLLETGPATTATVTKDEAIKYYTEMQTIRRMELKADQLYKQKGKISCLFISSWNTLGDILGRMRSKQISNF